MFRHTNESLDELDDYINQLEENIGLTPKTAIEVYSAIDKQRKKINLDGMMDKLIIGCCETFVCQCKVKECSVLTGKDCVRCGKPIW